MFSLLRLQVTQSVDFDDTLVLSRIQERALATGAFQLLVRGCETVYQWRCASHTLK